MKSTLREEWSADTKRAMRVNQRNHLAQAARLRAENAPLAKIQEELYHARVLGLRLDGWFGEVPRVGNQ